MNLDTILQLSPNLKQVVQDPTRLNPPKILDPIITTLSRFYQKPECLPPLDTDPDCDGNPADHMMVKMIPLSLINNQCARRKKLVRFRPFNTEKVKKMQEWIDKEEWLEVQEVNSAHEKMKIVQNILVTKYDEFFPEVSKTITSDDQPFYLNKLKKMKRRKNREFHKHRKSQK